MAPSHSATVPLPASPLQGEGFIDSRISSLTNYLNPGDILVFNDTRVIPARLYGLRGQVRVEVLLHKAALQPDDGSNSSSSSVIRHPTSSVPQVWSCFARPAKRLKEGDSIAFAEGFSAVVQGRTNDGEVLLSFSCSGDELKTLLQAHGRMPLPPYIEQKRPADARDRDDYQTVYAAAEGSIAAPTAGLHFTDALLSALEKKGVQCAHLTLHVGGGTFLPVKVDDTNDHVMHAESFHISAEAAQAISHAKASGGRVVAVGTTSLRTLESAADEHGHVHAMEGETSIFITPGYRFKCVDMLLTNFHLPKSTLFMLVSAFAGTERMKAAYAHAIAKAYRFYSYGDASLLYRHYDT